MMTMTGLLLKLTLATALGADLDVPDPYQSGSEDRESAPLIAAPVEIVSVPVLRAAPVEIVSLPILRAAPVEIVRVPLERSPALASGTRADSR
jgi:hypothetical protein